MLGIVFGRYAHRERRVAILYGLLYGFLVSKQLKLKELPRIILTRRDHRGVMITIAGAAPCPRSWCGCASERGAGLCGQHPAEPLLATFFLMFVLLILGCFLDPRCSSPCRHHPAGQRQRWADPIHYGIIMVIIMQVGAITPPVGTFLFISCGIARLPLEKSVKALLPYIITVLLVVLITVFVPQLVTLLPSLIYS